MSRVILYVATSLDGFIADSEGGVHWLPQPENHPDEKDAFGYRALLARVKTIIMGSRSYEQILGFGEWAWPEHDTVVFTSRPLKADRQGIRFVSTTPSAFMKDFRRQRPQDDIWLLGGAELAHAFAREKLIDECIITVFPMSLRDGIKLDLPYGDFECVRGRTCPAGGKQYFWTKKPC